MFSPARVVLASTLMLACGPGATPSAAPSADKPADAGPASSSGPTGAAADGGGAPVERKFAGSIGEATQIINELVDKRRDELKKCVNEYRARKNIPHEKVSLSLGIDQEGRLLGVALKNKKDDALTSCVSDGLKGLPFPKSHAGVITVSRTYEELVQ